jgi:GNAT superfamily N-acetyltransferase
MQTIRVDNTQLHNLKYFINNIGEAGKTFRYFQKRNCDVIKNHITTLLILNENSPIGYGHLEKEGENIWLGICVLPEFKGKGIGKVIMNELIKVARDENLKYIALTVDKDNVGAIKLYLSFGFKLISEEKDCFKYQLELL